MCLGNYGKNIWALHLSYEFHVTGSRRRHVNIGTCLAVDTTVRTRMVVPARDRIGRN